MEPLEFATSVSNTFRELADSFDIKYDRFIRTTDDDHKVAVEALWKRLEDAGQIYLGSYEGWYCVRDECYYTEGELVDGKAPTGAEVEWRAKEPSYFFKLSDWGDKLIELYEKEDILGPKSRKNEVLSFLKMEELRDLSISRTSFKWGLQVPGDPDHVVYVWVDALTNYLTAVGFGDDDSAEGSEYCFWCYSTASCKALSISSITDPFSGCKDYSFDPTTCQCRPDVYKGCGDCTSAGSVSCVW